MPHLIEIGRGPDGPVNMDVHLMLRQGLYVQANSGGGKSWLLRRLAEQLCPIVPTFVVDVEGEFSSLRERFPFFLVAKEGGDALADSRTAGALARKLLELRASAVFDIFGLDLEERHAWMKGFLHGLDQAPRDVWGDTAILIDEAHVFAPEKGKGESIALGGMAALATRGRKRGFGPVDATQRGAKFNKDVQSELKNAAVGLNTWEIDRERAREALGVGRRERDEYDKALRSMEAGEFFLVGRAFGTFDPVRVKVGPVHSTHPEPGQTKHLAAPPPPAKIRAMLAKLADLPKEEAAGAPAASGEVTALRAEVARLRGELAGVSDGGAAAERDRLRDQLRDIQVARQADAAALDAYADRERMLSKTLGVLESAFEAWTGREVNLSRHFPIEHERPLVDAGEPPWDGVQRPAPETVTYHRQPDGSTTREISTPPRTFFLNETHEHPRPAPRPRANPRPTATTPTLSRPRRLVASGGGATTSTGRRRTRSVRTTGRSTFARDAASRARATRRWGACTAVPAAPSGFGDCRGASP